MIKIFEKIFIGIYLQNLKYAVDKEMAAIKAIYFLSFLIWCNLVSITCSIILFSMGTIDGISSYFWIFFFGTSSLIIALFFYLFYMRMKRKLSAFNHVTKDTLSPKLIANIYIMASISFDIFVFILCVRS